MKKAADYFTRNQDQDTQFERVRLEERNKELESTVQRLKGDAMADRESFQAKITGLMAENTELVKSDKYNLERSKLEIETLQ